MRLATALALALCASASAAAQDVMVAVQVVHADHYLIGAPMIGATARVGTPLHFAGGKVHVSAEAGRSQSDRFGSPCGGYGPPGTCTAQPVEDRASMASLGVGLSYTATTSRPVDFGVDVDFRAVQWKASSRGQTTGEFSNTSNPHLGVGVDLRSRYTPSQHVPLAIEAGVGYVATMDLPGIEIADAYTPFATSITQLRYHLGVSWRR